MSLTADIVVANSSKKKYDPCDLLRYENFAIPCSYFSIGFATSFITTPLNVYMVDVLSAEPPMQSTIGKLCFLFLIYYLL